MAQSELTFDEHQMLLDELIEDIQNQNVKPIDYFGKANARRIKLMQQYAYIREPNWLFKVWLWITITLSNWFSKLSDMFKPSTPEWQAYSCINDAILDLRIDFELLNKMYPYDESIKKVSKKFNMLWKLNKQVKLTAVPAKSDNVQYDGQCFSNANLVINDTIMATDDHPLQASTLEDYYFNEAKEFGKID